MENFIPIDFSGCDEAVQQVKDAFRAELESKKRKFDEYVEQEQRKLADERKRFEKECRFMYQQYGVSESEYSAAEVAQVSTFPTPVKINVGGRIFQTTLTTLRGTHAGESGSMLAAMFSQRHPNCKDSEGNVFIDRNGDRFSHLLDYLITGKVGYFASLRRARGSGASASQSLEYEQMLVEAQYFQLHGILDVLQPGEASLDNVASYGILKSESIPSVAGSTVTWKWQHQRERSNSERYVVQDDGTITFTEAGSYLIMARVPGVSANNNGYVKLMLNGGVVGESWGNNRDGYHNMLYFNEVLQICAGCRFQLQGMNLSHSFNRDRALTTSLTIAPLDFPHKRVPFVVLESASESMHNGFWCWNHRAGNKTLVDTSSTGAVKFMEAGVYLVMVRVPGASSNNGGYAQLMLDGAVVGEAWSNNANAYQNMRHFSEVLEVAAGGTLQLQDISQSHSHGIRPLATVLAAVRLGSTLDDAHEGGADESTFCRYVSFSSHANGGNGGFWSWSAKKGCTELVEVAENGDTITISQAGTYLIMVRVPGVSSSNNGYAQLLLNGTAVGESWGNDASGYHNMLHFNEVLQISAGGCLQLQNVSLTHSFNMSRAHSCSLTVLLLAGDVGR